MSICEKCNGKFMLLFYTKYYKYCFTCLPLHDKEYIIEIVDRYKDNEKP